MAKLKTHSDEKKRFKLSKTGKVKMFHAYKSHLLNGKSRKRKRNLRHAHYADETNAANIRLLVPYK